MTDSSNSETKVTGLLDRAKFLIRSQSTKSIIIFVFLSLIFLGPIAFHFRPAWGIDNHKYYLLSGEDSFILIPIDLLFIAILAVGISLTTSSEPILRRRAWVIICALPIVYLPLSTLLNIIPQKYNFLATVFEQQSQRKLCWVDPKLDVADPCTPSAHYWLRAEHTGLQFINLLLLTAIVSVIIFLGMQCLLGAKRNLGLGNLSRIFISLIAGFIALFASIMACSILGLNGQAGYQIIILYCALISYVFVIQHSWTLINTIQISPYKVEKIYLISALGVLFFSFLVIFFFQYRLYQGYHGFFNQMMVVAYRRQNWHFAFSFISNFLFFFCVLVLGLWIGSDSTSRRKTAAFILMIGSLFGFLLSDISGTALLTSPTGTWYWRASSKILGHQVYMQCIGIPFGHRIYPDCPYGPNPEPPPSTTGLQQ